MSKFHIAWLPKNNTLSFSLAEAVIVLLLAKVSESRQEISS